MTDATFYTAYDDMPPAVVRLRRGRKPRRGYGGLGLLWVMAASATALSAVPALGPGDLRMPALASRLLPIMQVARALPVPPDVTLAPVLQPHYLAGEPSVFADTHPLSSRFIYAGASVLASITEAPAPTVTHPAIVASAEEAPAPGPQLLALNDTDDDAQSVVPSMPATTSPLVAVDVPLPMPRPNDLAPTVTHVPPFRATRRPTVMASAAPAATTSVSPDNRSFLEKFFSMGQQPKASPALGYAAPEDGFFSGLRGAMSGNPARSYGQNTAVYDIAGHTVYLPDGTRLEAHSGLGEKLDNPSFVHEPMRGPTPPATYALTMRESLFHGVQALRLTPVGSRVFGRVGLLAHTYMLGPRGDSNGCVSFRNYRTFLQAFQNGDVRRLVVVARLS